MLRADVLVEFRVENHRSIREEQVLTMEAGRVGTADDPRPRSVDGYREPLLPVAAVYGANASGKSNLLDALGYMQIAVLHSHLFELWLLLYFQDNPGPQHRDRIKEMLANKLPGYDKTIDFSKYLEGLNVAAVRAKRINDMALQDGEPLFSNPSTSVYLLLGSMAKELKEDERLKHWDWIGDFDP